MAGLEIFAWIHGDSPASNQMFSVRAPDSMSVSEWKKEVYTKKRNSLDGYGAADLVIWKLHDPIPGNETDREVAALSQNLSAIATKMLPARELSDYFSTPPAENCLHVIVMLPSSRIPGDRKRKDRDDEDPEDRYNPVQKRGPSHWGPKMVVTNSTWCQRQETVSSLLELLHKYHLVQVHGTPASGKTTLMLLLHARIVMEHPKAQIFMHQPWPQPLPGLQDNVERLNRELPGYPAFEGRERYFLIDEGQTTYRDTALWVALKKYIQPNTNPIYAILFCSYGNEDVSDPPIPTPLVFKDARVTLERTSGALAKPCGLLLDEGEFHDVVGRRPGLLLADDLRDFVYSFTRGHVGAVVAVIGFILEKRKTSVPAGVAYCLEDFHRDTASYDGFSGHLSMDRGVGRGIPRHPARYAQAMRALLLHEAIHSDTEYEGVNNNIRLNLHEAYKFGVVHMDSGLYTFASPLHQQLWSWHLLPQINDQLPFQDLFSLVKRTVSRFRPSQLDESDGRVGSACHWPPEAQYQKEYYRCVHALTQGNVRISPEYAAAAGSRPGRPDFFIPSMCWGIELVRDGRKLGEHNSSFADDGAYGQWLASSDMVDYVLLDFRSTKPVQAHPGIDKLYSVVFSNNKTQVEVYDNHLNLQYSQNLMQQG